MNPAIQRRRFRGALVVNIHTNVSAHGQSVSSDPWFVCRKEDGSMMEIIRLAVSVCDLIVRVLTLLVSRREKSENQKPPVS